MEKGGHKAPNIEAVSESLNHSLKASLCVSLNYRGTPWQEPPNAKPPSGTRGCVCVAWGCDRSHVCTSDTHSLYEATARNQRDTETSLWCQNPAQPEEVPWWVSTVRPAEAPWQCCYQQICWTQACLGSLSSATPVKPSFALISLPPYCSLRTYLIPDLIPWLLSTRDWRSPWIKLANRSTPEVLWRSSRNYICFSGRKNYQPGGENEHS